MVKKRLVSMMITATMITSSLQFSCINAAAAEPEVTEAIVQEVADEASSEEAYDEETAYEVSVDEETSEGPYEDISEEVPEDTKTGEGETSLLEDGEENETVIEVQEEEIVSEPQEEESLQLETDSQGYTLDANGGVFTDGNAKQEISSTYSTGYLTNEEYFPTREGYAFRGWKKINDAVCVSYDKSKKNFVLIQSALPLKGGTTLYARWAKLHTFTIVLDEDDNLSNGGGYVLDEEGKKTSVVTYVADGDSIKDSDDSTFLQTKFDHTFPGHNAVGYYKNASGSGANIYDSDPDYLYYGNSYDILSKMYILEDTVVYAGFKDNGYAITLHDDDGYFEYSSSEYFYEGKYHTYVHHIANTASYKAYYSVLAEKCLNDDLTKAFEGLYYDAAFANPVAVTNDEINLSELDDAGKLDDHNNLDLYVKWSSADENVMITFDPNGGVLYDAYAPASSEKNEIIVEPVAVARRDYNYFNLRPVYLKDRHMTFTGWYSDKACTQLVTDSDFVYIGSKTSAQDTPIFTSSTTLYAGWTSSRYVITFKAPDGCTLSGLDYDYEIQEEINGASTFICTIDKNSEDKSIGYRLPEVSYSDAQTDFYKWKLKSSGKEYTSEELMNYKFTKDDEVTPVSRRVCSITWNYGTEMVNHNAEEGSIFLEKADKGDEVYPYNGMENISRTKYVEGYYLDSSFTNPLIKAGEYSYKVTGNVIIYAKWADYYTVTFDLGSLYINGSHTIEKKYIKKGEVLDYCPEETPVSEGDRSSFNGWRKDGKQITPEEIKTLVVNENFTISADYDETVFIRFDVNTSSTTARVTYNLDWANNEYGVIAVKKGSNLSGYEFPGASYAQNNVTYEGNSTEYYKTFEGWFRDKACSVPVDRNSYIANENDTFYAKWGTDTFYTITFVNTRPGLGEMCYGKAGLLLRYDHGDVFVPKGAPYAFNGVDVGEGYEFPHIVIDEDNRQTLEALPTGEWSTKEDGTGQRWFLDGKRGYYIDETGNKHSFAPGTFVPTKDMTFYSVWDEGITVTLDLNGGNADRDDGYRYIDNPFTVRENGTKLTARLPEGISYEELEQLIPVRLSNDSEKSIFWGYKDKACSDAFKGSDVLTQDTTVYALYTSHSEATLAFYSTDEGYFVTTQNGKTEKTGSKIYKVNVPAKGVYKTELDIPVTGDDHKAFSGMYAPSRNGDTPDLSRPCPYTVYEDGKWYLAVNNKYVNNSNYLAAYTDASVVTVDAGEYGHFGDTRGVRREIVAAGRDIELSKYEELLIPNDGAWPLGWYYRDSNNIEQKLIVTWTESGKTLYKPTGDIDIYYKWGIGSTGRRVENVDVSANNATVLEIGEKKSLLSTLSPSGVNADVTWYLADVTYGNSNRAKECPVILKSDGTVTGRAEGTAKVYAIADGKRSDDVTVTVSSEPSVNGLKEPYCTPYVENGGERIVTKGTRVILGSSTPGALIMYALDDGEYSVYSNAIVIAKDTVIKAYAISENFNRSAEVTFSFRLSEDYGDIDEALMNSIFEGSVANVPSDLWFALKSEETGEYVRIDNLDPNTAHTGKSAALAKATGLSFVYTGSKITFNDSIRVFYGKNRLIEGRDYNVSYANNTAVASETALKTPGFTVSGKGNYSGAMNFKFGITCADINGAEITTEKEVCLSSGSKLSQVAPKLAFNGQKLSLNKDYVLNYYVGSVGSNNLITASELKNFKAEVGKTYVVEIAGKEGGNFTASSKTETVLVKAYDSSNKSYVQASKLKIGDVKGKAVKIPYADRTAMSQEPDEYLDTLFDNRDGKTPVICVFNAKNVLTYNKDFTVDLVRSADFPELADEHYYAGTYSFVISGVSKEESGLSEGEVIVVGSKIASYEITGTPMKNVKLAGLATTVEYTGKEISLSDLFNARDKNLERDWMAVTLYTADKSKTKHALTEGADYSVSMKNTGKVGQFSLEFVGKNGYSGGIKKTITVKPYNLKDDALKMLNITIGDQHVYYSKAGAKCKDVTVRFGDDMILREGIDYTLSYKNNSKVADAAAAGSKAPMLLVTGKGNFTGASAAKTFTIEKAPFDTDHISFAIDDVKYNSNGKDGYFMPSAKFTDGGKAIAIGRDKDIELPDKYDYRYFYIGTATMTDGTIRNDGEEADPKDRPVAGTAIGVEVYVTCPEKSPYYSKGTIKGSYRVIDASKDISSAKVTVKDASGLVFSGGMEIIPMSEDDIKVTVNGKELSSEEYRIVSVSDNRFIGTATVTIEGTGEYGGRKIFKFKISARAVS